MVRDAVPRRPRALTAIGGAFFFVPILVLTLGLIHGELTSLLWGGGFGFAWGYTVTARILMGRHPVVKKPQGRIETLAGRLSFHTESRPPAPAFFRWSLVVEAFHSPQRIVRTSVPFEAPRTDFDLSLKRGSYHLTVRWEMTDLFGFTRLVPAVVWESTLTVVPEALPFNPPPPPSTKPGPWRPHRAGRRAGEPFDVRHYSPGDDLRRLHWPLYAHAGVPFVRTAEPTPPPTGHQFLILDTDAPNEEVLDDRLGRLVTWLTLLDAQGTGWTLAIPSAGLVIHGDPGPVLAALSPAPLPEGPIEGWPEGISLLTGPGNRGSRRYRTVVVAPPDEPIPPRTPWWRRVS